MTNSPRSRETSIKICGSLKLTWQMTKRASAELHVLVGLPSELCARLLRLEIAQVK
jgi:hypothetical protein